MNIKNTNNKFKIILSVGDESGVGPEIILKALCSSDLPQDIDFSLVGSKKNLINTYKHLRTLGLENLANPSDFKIHDLETSPFDKTSESYYGDLSFKYLVKAIELVRQHPNSAIVTGPICKKSWTLAGHYFSGQTEVLAKSCGAKNVGMLFTAKSPITGWRFNTLLATTHIALCEVPKHLNIELIHSKLDLFKDFCNTYVKKPTLRVAGINPHAGEEGILGNEEKNWLSDALIEWNEKNKEIKLLGPLSPDSCWNSSAKAWTQKDAETHDGILAMYHDQGLIPMKVIAQNYSVNTTLGLPFIRTSPDHGTGFDIAGEGVAQCQSMIEAIKAAVEMTKNSKLLNAH
tara:strand:- start:202 stop:1236 length:1035 start_codon:yes stop_codon:yes gene_type:complete